MDERWQHKILNRDQHSLLNSRIRYEIAEAKRAWLQKECQEMEKLQVHGTQEQKKLKELVREHRTKEENHFGKNILRNCFKTMKDKLIDDDNIILLLNIFNTKYNQGKFFPDWLKSSITPIPKKSNARRCS